MPGEKNDLLFISIVLLGLKCSISQLLLRMALLHKSHKLLQCHQQQLRIMYEPHFYRKFRDNALRMQQCYCNNVHFLPFIYSAVTTNLSNTLLATLCCGYSSVWQIALQGLVNQLYTRHSLVPRPPLCFRRLQYDSLARIT